MGLTVDEQMEKIIEKQRIENKTRYSILIFLVREFLK